MDQSESDRMTPFDRLITSKHLQMLKLIIPYTPVENQRMLAIYTKFMELEYTIQFFRHFRKDIHAQAFQTTVSSPLDMLDELRPYLPEEDQNMLDTLLNMLNMVEMFSAMENMTGNENGHSDMGDINPMDIMKGMLKPEQQEMFERYNSMFQEQEPDQNPESKDSESKGDSVNG